MTTEELRNTIVFTGSQEVKHWVSSENEFVFNFINYERDPENGRCYRLVESSNLRPEWDGALVKQRISAKRYYALYNEAVAAVEEHEAWRQRISRKA